MRRIIVIASAAVIAAAAGYGASLLVGRAPSRSSAEALSLRSHDLGPDAFTAVACSNRRHCVALGPGGWLAMSTDGGSNWRTSVDASLVRLTVDYLACPTARRCVAIATPAVSSRLLSGFSTRARALAAPSDVLLVSSDGGASWRAARAPGGVWLGGLSCPTAAVCYASAEVRGEPSRRFLLKSSDGGLNWVTGPKAAPGSLGAISCPGIDRCYAIGGSSGLELTTDGGVSWQLEHDSMGSMPLSVVECATTSRCVALGEAIGPLRRGGGFPWMALYAVSTTDGGRKWHHALVQANYSQMEEPGITAASCEEGGTFCLAVGAMGIVAVTKDGGLSWDSTGERGGPFRMLDSATCAAAVGCLMSGTGLEGGGLVASLSATNPPAATGSGPGRGSVESTIVVRLQGFGGEWTSISCPDSRHCVAVGGGESQGQQSTFAEVMTSSDGGWSWSGQRPPAGVLGLSAVDCPSVRRCYATGVSLLPPKQQTPYTNEVAIVLESRDGGRLWQRVAGDPGVFDLNAISCPTVATCFAVGDTLTGDGTTDAVIATTDGGARWHEEAVPGAKTGVLLDDISCPSASDCWAGGGSDLVATTDGGLRWRQLGSGWVDSLSCATVRRCVAMGVSGGESWELVGSGLSYRFVAGSAPAFQPSASEVCPSATVCVAAGAMGETTWLASVYISHDGGRSWAEMATPSLVAIGSGFEAPATYFPWPQEIGDAPAYGAVACSSARHCVLLGSGADTEALVSG